MATRLHYKHKLYFFKPAGLSFIYLGVSAFISGINEQGLSLRTVPCVVLEMRERYTLDTFYLDLNISFLRLLCKIKEALLTVQQIHSRSHYDGFLNYKATVLT